MAPIQRRKGGHAVVQKTPSSASATTTSTSQSGCQATSSSTSVKQSEDQPFGGLPEVSGLVISVHPVWPDFQLVQGELFFECTLFLYSVLALFLQYLNLYKSLWWLPKSYWHYSMKLHHINPYFLSCVGLLLGLRVTKCFWNTITELIASCSEGASEAVQTVLRTIEYVIIKLPVTGMVFTSFFFSFSRIVREFPLSSVVYFFFPPVLYVWLFWRESLYRFRRFRETARLALGGKTTAKEVLETLSDDDPGWLDIDNVAHMCSNVPSRIREEVRMLIDDCGLRIKRCLFAGATTAFLSIGLPLVFVPYKTSLDKPQKMLILESWELEMAMVVFGTAFTHYVTYLFPLQYLDLMYRSAMHLGRWEVIAETSPVTTTTSSTSILFGGSAATSSMPASLARRIPVAAAATPSAPEWDGSAPPYPEGSIVQLTADGKRYKAVPVSNKVRTVAAEPDCASHVWFAYWCAHPLSLINLLCAAEFVLIFGQFWLLVLTTEWQHIVTLVLLMFANYLLLAKLFKDRVIINRIYEPSKEDMALIEQVQTEAAQRRREGVRPMLG